MWLCNETDRAISDKVYLGINADENEWRDITEEEKTRLEQLWSEETPEIEEATEADYISALKIIKAYEASNQKEIPLSETY